jgi:aminopeptidase YwaD
MVNIAIDRERLRHNLEQIVGERSPFSSRRHLSAVEDFVEREFANYSLAVESDFFTYRGTTFRNVIAWLRSRQDDPLIILGAHIDSVQGTPGADDNASGIVVLLAQLRGFAGVKAVK